MVKNYESNKDRLKKLLDELSADIEREKSQVINLRRSVDEMASEIYLNSNKRWNIILLLQEEWRKEEGENGKT